MAAGICFAVAMTAPVPTITNLSCPDKAAAARKM
jgi:hypothetical protein